LYWGEHAVLKLPGRPHADDDASPRRSAGVSGLTTALLLARRREHTITVVAKHMPGDYDIEYTSPWAGANVMPCVVLHPTSQDMVTASLN